MKGYKKIVSAIMVLLVLFSVIYFPRLKSDNVREVYGSWTPTTDEEIVQADYDWLEPYILNNYYSSFLDQVRENLKLPTVGDYGSSISWWSSDTTVIALDGTVTRPTFTQGHKELTLKATIVKGTASKQKEFWVTVISQKVTNIERVTLDKAWLTDELVLNGNSADNVKTRLNLPKEGQVYHNDPGSYSDDIRSSISWTSSKPGIIDIDGRVTRPAEIQGDQLVTLTATILYEGATEIKAFTYVVTMVEQFPLAIKLDDFSNIGDSLQFNGKSGIIDTTDGDGNSIKALQFTNDGTLTGGSVFTRKKVRLADDLSFSTAFAYRNTHPQYALGDGGFTFTLQAADSTVFGQNPESLGAGGIVPSLSIAVDSLYYSGSGGGQATSYGFSESVAVFYNGNNDASGENGRYHTIINGETNPAALYTFMWVEYNGGTRTLEIRYNNYGSERPVNPALQVQNADLANILTNGGVGIQNLQEVYVGFTGSVGSPVDEYNTVVEKNEICSWYFKNDSIPIDLSAYMFFDASDITLAANPPGGQSSSTVTASVYGSDGALAGIPIDFSTSFGSLDSSTVITNSSGMASVNLSTTESGTAAVKAIAAGGAMALIEVPLAFTDADRLAADEAWLSGARILNGNSFLDSVTYNLTLPVLGLSGSIISWDTSESPYLNNIGQVTTPSLAVGNQQVILTATLSNDSGDVVKTFDITVKVSDEVLVAADSALLTAEVIRYQNNALGNVTANLNLPVSGANGTTIGWASSNENVLKPDGTVIRPAYLQGDKQVVLTATISKGSESFQKTFNITVKSETPSENEAQMADYIWLTDALILNGDIEHNNAPGNVTANLYLPVSGPNGSTISWESTNEGVVELNGTVIRPAYTQGNKTVFLTATLSKGTEEPLWRVFMITVVTLGRTDVEAVASDKAWLNSYRTLGNNKSPFSICENLQLPDTASEGSIITWASNNTGVITNEGVVTRPGHLEGHKTVIMTATLKIGDVQDTKELSYTVLAIPDTTHPEVSDFTIQQGSSGEVLWNATQITITFNEEVKKGMKAPSWPFDLNSEIKLQGPDALQLIYANIVKDKLIINFGGYLKAGEHELLIPAGIITDMSGNALGEFRQEFTVEKKLENKIEVISSSPENGEKEVYVDPIAAFQMSFKFSYSEIEKSIGFYGITLRTKDGKSISTACDLNGDTVTIREQIWGTLDPGAIYELYIPSNAVKDRFGNESIGKVIQFRTQGLEAAPVITGSYPNDGQAGVDVNQDMEVYFSKTLNPADCKLKLRDNKGNVTSAGIYKLNAPQTGVVISPYQPLKPNTLYTVSGPYDSTANPMDIEYQMSFTTGANSLGIDKIYPTSTDDKSGAPINTSVEITFSSTVIRGEEFDNIQISDSEGNDVFFGLVETDNKVVLEPSSKLTPSETYTVHIPGGAYKNESNSVNDELLFKFTAAKSYSPGNATFSMEPSASWLVNKPMVFNAAWLEKSFGYSKYQITSFEWDFGDGNTGSGKNPSHTFTETKEYQVRLTVKDQYDITYEFERKVTIEDFTSGMASISVSPNWIDELAIIDSDYLYKTFTINLSYNGIYLPGESIKVQLYKNGIWQKELGTAVTGNNGTAGFNFWYGGKGYLGPYELAFEHGGKVKRVPVRIKEYTAKQALRIKLYGTYDYPYDLYFELDGVQKRAVRQWYDHEWANDLDGYCYVINDVTVNTYHTLKLVSSYDHILHYTDTETIYHSGSEYAVTLYMKEKKPGIYYIKSKLSDSRNNRTTLFIDHVDMPPVSFEVVGNWDGLAPGYYEIKADTGRLNIKSKEPIFELIPGFELWQGESLLVRMVSLYGIKTPWVDVNVEVIPRPSMDIGFGLNVTYVDGEYRVSSPLGLSELIGGRVSVLDGIPLLDNAQSFGLGFMNNKLEGAITENGFLQLKFEGDFAYGKSKNKTKMVSVGYDVETQWCGLMQLAYNRDSKKWNLYYAEITLMGDGSYHWTRSYTVPKIKIGVDATLRLGSVIGGTFILDRSENSKREYGGIIYLEPYVVVSISAGVKGGSVEGYVEGRIDSEIHIPTGYIQVEPNITAGISATILGYTKNLYSKKLVDEHWDNGKEKITTLGYDGSQQLMVKFDTYGAQFEPMSRNYLSRESQWTEGSQKEQGMSLLAAAEASPYMMGEFFSYSAPTIEETNPQVEIRKSNIYPEAEVQLVRNGDELWMVWTDDNTGRSDMNRTQMIYSVLKDGAWSNPSWIGEDGTADFSPAAASTGDGVLMAWQNIKQVMPEDADLEAVVANAEISVTQSVYRTGDSDVQMVTLTDDDKFDHSPRLAADGDKGLLVWTKSDGLGFTFGEDTEELPANRDRLFFSSWDGSSWTQAAEIDSSLTTVVDSYLTMHGQEGLLLYTLDTDNDQSTQIGKELYARIYSGGSWGEEVLVTSNQLQVTNPKAVYVNGEWFITWVQDGSIMYKEGLSGETRTDATLSSIQSDYEITVNQGANQQIALVYKHISEKNVRTLSTSFYDVEKGVWSHEIQLTEEEKFVRSFSPVFTEDGKLNIAYTQAEIITEVVDGVEYFSTSDEVDLNRLTYTPMHDLALDEEDGLQLSADIPLPGTMETVSVTIRNDGDFAEYATLYLYDGNPEDGGVRIGEATTEQPIPARSSAQVEIEWLVGAEEKDAYDIHAVVHTDVSIIDINESNNSINHKVSTADIMVVSLEYENLAEDDYLVTATVANRGSKTLEGVKVQLVQSANGQILETREFDTITSGQEVGLRFLISSNGLAEDENGKISLMLKALLPAGVEENSTDNNTFVFALEPAPILVYSTNPSQDETQVEIQKPLTLSFNMNVQEGNGFDQIELQDDYLNIMDINKTLEGDTLTITPNSTLAHNTRYTLTIPVDALGDSYGHTLDDPYSLSFITTTSSPEVVFAYPGSGMGSVALETEIKMQFNQSILNGPTFGDIAMYGPDSQEISASVSLQGEWLYLRDTGSLNENTSYSLIIPRGAVKNSEGEAQQEDYTLEFTTIAADSGGSGDDGSGDSDTTAPTVVLSHDNASNTVKQGDEVTIIATFNEDLGDTPTIIITNGGVTVATMINPSSDKRTWTYNWAVPAGNESITVTVAGYDIAGNGYAGGDNLTFTKDNTIPAVVSVSAPEAGTYVAGQNLDFALKFNKTVIADNTQGTPSIPITLNVGGIVNASYVCGSNSETLVFRRTVQAGDEDLNGITIGDEIVLNGGTLKDAAGNNATLTLNGVASTTGIKVDTTAPKLNGATRTDNTHITVTLSEDCTNIVKDNNGGFTVHEAGNPGNTYGVSAIAQGIDADHVVLTVADMGVSAKEGITVKYTAGGNGTVQDTAGNAMATDSIGVTVAGWGNIVDLIAPITGSSGTISISSVTRNSMNLAWTAATDEATAQSNLQYKVVRSTGDNINSLNDAEVNGILVQNWTPNLIEKKVTGLASSTTYYFNIIVRDEAGNKAVYTGVSRKTPAAPDNDSTMVQLKPIEITSGNEKLFVEVTSDSRTGNIAASIDGNLIEQLYEKAEADENGRKTILMEMPVDKAAGSYTLQVPLTGLSSKGTGNEILLKTVFGTIGIPENMLTGLENLTGEKAAITIGQGDKTTLPYNVKDIIGDRPLIQFTLTVDGKQVNWNNPDAPVTVALPYSPTEEELKNPEHIVVWYIDGSGKVVSIPSGRYDPATGTVTFTTTHFSQYAVAYVTKTFNDLGSVTWAKKPIEVLMSKGILKGTSEAEYTPKASITRADFLYFLVRTLGVDAKVDGNFDDISSDAYYYEELGIAKKLGITNGTGNDKFSPDADITRQDMMVLTERALRMLKELKEQGSATDLEKFTDKSLVAAYAVNGVASVVKEGLIIGSDSKVNPLGNTTRAEAAVFLHRIYNKY